MRLNPSLTEAATAIAAGLQVFTNGGSTAPLDNLYTQARQTKQTAIASAVAAEKRPVGLSLAATDVRLEPVENLLSRFPEGLPEESLAAKGDYWKNRRKKIGLSETHDNALYVVFTLGHADKIVNNANRDILPREEVQKALDTLNLQPIDISPEFDQHLRERLGFFGANGIRGVIYGARLLEDNSIECGGLLWAVDFPSIVEQVVDFRESLGASFDVLGGDWEIVKNEGDELPHRILRDLTFLGGTIIRKTRAADTETSVGEIRYMDKPIEEILKEQSMGQQAGQEGAAAGTAAAAGAPQQQTVQQQTPSSHEALVASLAQAQAAGAEASNRANALQATITEKEAALAAKDAEIETLKAKITAAETAQAEAERKLAETEAAAQRSAALTARMAELDTLATEAGVPVFENDAARATAEQQIVNMDDNAWKIYSLERRADAFRAAREKLVAGQAASNGSNGAAAETKTTPVGGLASATVAGGSSATDDSPTAIGAGLAAAFSGRSGAGASA